MKLGLLTAAFPDLTLEEVADWAGANGFETLEIACWPAGGGEKRRYAGVSHIDTESLDAAGAAAIRELLTARGLEISSLAYYPNHLHPDRAHRAEVNAHLGRVVDAAALLGVDVVGTFVGADPARSLTENLRSFAEVWPRARRPRDAPRASRSRSRTARCCSRATSGRSARTWRARRTSGARCSTSSPTQGFGLNLDPSHLVWQMIDYERVVYDFADRILHVHAKDMEIDRGGLYEHGVLSAGMNWQVPRLPGLGEVRWDRFCSALYAVGYDRWISIEHEDRAFEGDVELVKRGFLIARDALRPYVH